MMLISAARERPPPLRRERPAGKAGRVLSKRNGDAIDHSNATCAAQDPPDAASGDARARELAGRAERINAHHEAGLRDLASAIGHFAAAGRELIEAKAELHHGEWLPWLGANFKFTVRTAQKYMSFAALLRYMPDLASEAGELSFSAAHRLLREEVDKRWQAGVVELSVVEEELLQWYRHGGSLLWQARQRLGDEHFAALLQKLGIPLPLALEYIEAADAPATPSKWRQTTLAPLLPLPKEIGDTDDLGAPMGDPTPDREETDTTLARLREMRQMRLASRICPDAAEEVADRRPQRQRQCVGS